MSLEKEKAQRSLASLVRRGFISTPGKELGDRWGKGEQKETLDGKAKPFNGQPARKSGTVRATLRRLEKLREPRPATVCRPDLRILAPITIISQAISGTQEI